MYVALPLFQLSLGLLRLLYYVKEDIEVYVIVSTKHFFVTLYLDFILVPYNLMG